jgi:antitoxin component of MazEF toxin-antitoxin module
MSGWGNSLALRIPSEVVRQLGLREGAAVEAQLTVDGTLSIRPAHWNRKAFALGHALTTVGNKRTATEDWLPVGFGGRISANVSGCRYRLIEFYSVRRPLYPRT